MGRRKKKRNPQHIRSTFLNEFAQPRERRKREKETKKKHIKFEMIFGLLVCLFCLAQGAPAVEMDAATSQSLYQMTTSFLQAVMAAAVSALFVILCYAMKRKEQNLFNAKRGYSVRNYFRDTIDSFERRTPVSQVENLPLWQVPPLKSHRTNRQFAYHLYQICHISDSRVSTILYLHV